MNKIKLKFGDVRRKRIKTPNQFVSHMLEHIAWRLGLEIELIWENANWRSLGRELGKEISKFPSFKKSAASIGMIDDGAAEVAIDRARKGLTFRSAKTVDLKWFLSSRCEQLSSGRPLVELLKGLSDGLGARVEINVCTFEDPHHTWEGIFRGIGITLGKLYPSPSRISFAQSLRSARAARKTAETTVTVDVELNSRRKNQISISVDPSISVRGIETLLAALANSAGFSLTVAFDARVLSSSHVVFEDIGLVLGQALLDLARRRMNAVGINGAGSNVERSSDLEKPVGVSLSIEGRKFLKIFSSNSDYTRIRRELLIGKNVTKQVRSEDLDDFLDGLAGGMRCSLLINVRKIQKPGDFWSKVFVGLGEALEESFRANPNRKGVIAGVKGTLA